MNPDLAGRIKTQAASAWIGAALLLFFGFGYLSEPSGTDLFAKAYWVLLQTLRVGGIAMAVVALFLMTGQAMALACDAFVSIAVGLLLIGTGVVMFVDGGDIVQSAINVICGSGFASSGRRSWQAYAAMRARAPSPSEPPPLTRGDQGGSPVSPPTRNAKKEPRKEESSDPLRTSNFELPTSPPAAAGYLAALAEKRRKERDESSS